MCIKWGKANIILTFQMVYARVGYVTKVICYIYIDDLSNDEDMLRQMRNLYIRSNKILRTLHYCSSDVKLELFKSYCTSFYCCYLWTAYKKSTFDRFL